MEYLIEGLKKEELNHVRGGQECVAHCRVQTCSPFTCENLQCNNISG